ncbi:MAG: hypothetical protein MJE77_02330 [Proteobacteria bacterium]|nr:hypothetical protein [Pseudomonadota bacterium]
MADEFCSGAPWADVGDELVDTRLVPGLLLLDGSAGRPLRDGEHFHFSVLTELIDREFPPGMPERALGRAFGAAIATHWGFLALLGARGRRYLKRPAYRKELLSASVRYWSELDAEGPRYSSGSTIGLPLWQLFTNIKHCLHCEGLPRACLDRPLPSGGIAELIRLARRNRIADGVRLRASERGADVEYFTHRPLPPYLTSTRPPPSSFQCQFLNPHSVSPTLVGAPDLRDFFASSAARQRSSSHHRAHGTRGHRRRTPGDPSCEAVIKRARDEASRSPGVGVGSGPLVEGSWNRIPEASQVEPDPVWKAPQEPVLAAQSELSRLEFLDNTAELLDALDCVARRGLFDEVESLAYLYSWGNRRLMTALAMVAAVLAKSPSDVEMASDLAAAERLAEADQRALVVYATGRLGA